MLGFIVIYLDALAVQRCRSSIVLPMVVLSSFMTFLIRSTSDSIVTGFL